MKVTAQTTETSGEPGASAAAEPPPPPDWAWTLPDGPECARHARAALDGVLAALGLSAGERGDARLMVSELATNAHQHATAPGPHELWLTRGPAGELRCAVFDRDTAARLPGYSWTSGDCGRGLSIVRELSDGRWGVASAVARLGEPGPGKAVWFVIPRD
ncbi:ATP-binding protein [Actinomadura atramentaria]|uniref:ATP-binding protein n=1 Tax=Actinomadura atramentaria TaxID=1990 RepID=UPI00036F65A0|nr:ATP-binding protein [Actinomadura atramentaria]